MSIVRLVESIRKEVRCFSTAIDCFAGVGSSLYERIYSIVSEVIDRIFDEHIAEISNSESESVANAAYYLNKFFEEAVQELKEATSVAVVGHVHLQHVKSAALLPKRYGMLFSLIAEKFRTTYLQRHQDRGKSDTLLNDNQVRTLKIKLIYR